MLALNFEFHVYYFTHTYNSYVVVIGTVLHSVECLVSGSCVFVYIKKQKPENVSQFYVLAIIHSKNTHSGNAW